MSQERCENEGCGHSPDQHGARGYGACRFGFHGVLSSLLSDTELVANGYAVECRCKRFRVRPVKPLNPPAKHDAPRDGGGGK